MAERIRCSPVACAYSLRLHSAQIWYERTRLGLGRSRDDCQIGRHAEDAILPLSFPHRAAAGALASADGCLAQFLAARPASSRRETIEGAQFKRAAMPDLAPRPDQTGQYVQE